MRIVRDAILGADKRMREKVKYGNVMFDAGDNSDFAAFVDTKRRGVNLMLMRGRQLTGTYPHLVGASVKRVLIADGKEARARAAELRAMAKEWCEIVGASAGGGTSGRSARRSSTRPSAGASRSSSR